MQALPFHVDYFCCTNNLGNVTVHSNVMSPPSCIIKQYFDPLNEQMNYYCCTCSHWYTLK